MYDYPQNTFELKEEITTPLAIIHAPNSLIDLRSANSTDNNIRRLSDNFDYGLRSSNEIYHQELANKLQEELRSRDKGTYNAVINFLNENSKDNLYGDFQPNHLNINYSEGESVNPALFLAEYLLEQRNKNSDKILNFVFHPDIIYFLTQGDRSKEVKTVKSIDELCKALNVSIFFENVHFLKPSFQNALPWMSDPINLRNMIKDFTNLGLAVDLDHLLKEGWSEERIINTTCSLLNELKSRAIIHSRTEHNSKFVGLYEKCVKQAVPWVNEDLQRN